MSGMFIDIEYRHVGAFSRKRVACALGPGRHVLIPIRTGKNYRGDIETVSTEGLTLRLDPTDQSVRISCKEIDHLEQNLSRMLTCSGET